MNIITPTIRRYSLPFLLIGCSMAGRVIYAEPVPLFDGSTLSGWKGNTCVWRVEKGEIVAGKPNVRQTVNQFLCTTREYRDFDLRLKYKRGGNNGGVQIRSQRVPGNTEVAGFQSDFGAKIDGFLYDEYRRRRNLAQPDEATVAKLHIGEWNSCHIRAEGPRIRVWINEVLTVDYTEEDPAIPRTGIIGLQIHAKATEIRYKDLVIEDLNDAAWKPDAGFTPLFNGQNLEGWHYEGAPDLQTAIQATDERYTAEAGYLVVNPANKTKGPHLRQLWTTRDFPQDFILKLEFRASPNADSGVFIRGKQIQCRDHSLAGPDYYKRRLKNYRPQDWNTLEFTVTGTSTRCTCNGDVLETNFAVPATGLIGLEADRGTLEYRRIQIKTIKQ